jgi:2-keto-4-pentenoate hydratase
MAQRTRSTAQLAVYFLFVAAAMLSMTLAGMVQAACLSDSDAALLVQRYMLREPAPNPEGLSEADGVCSREKVNGFLAQRMGKAVGYKAGLTNPAVQKRFNYDKPVRGTLYADMLKPDGVTLDAKFGARPLFEADLLLRVSDARIARARTPSEVLRYVDQVIPFIELPDLLVEAPPKLNGPAINAINVGARLGVMGKPIPVLRRETLVNALRDMQVLMYDGSTEIDRGKGSDVLDHPLNAAIWLAMDLAKEGKALKKGDLISVGSFSKLLPPKPGMSVRVVYDGLPGNPSVSVNFR